MINVHTHLTLGYYWSKWTVLAQHATPTIMIDAVNQPHPDLGVVVSHQNDVEKLLTVWVQLPQSGIHSHKSLWRFSVYTGIRKLWKNHIALCY